MTKRTYAEHKLSDKHIEQLKIQAIREKISQAELITKAIEKYLHEALDKHDNRE